MKTDPTLRFFKALSETSKRLAGADSDLAEAAAEAVSDPTPANFVRAQEQLAHVEEDLRAQILRDVHRHMSRDISAIWDSMRTATGTDRPN
ncbi:hypothetical protein [Roseobacter sinensis]|uniref:Uncharacterized protein n=1 Tax=Roseobacter sinensis TaxID=2931391 RepID=A0ABT3BL16_9RHOB|nr:hypothetical protein [Roseobacter sp. WL0113]MCV3274256.1 hypothetical protein [Roseobacter sp. WL0113]